MSDKKCECGHVTENWNPDMLYCTICGEQLYIPKPFAPDYGPAPRHYECLNKGCKAFRKNALPGKYCSFCKSELWSEEGRWK